MKPRWHEPSHRFMSLLSIAGAKTAVTIVVDCTDFCLARPSWARNKAGAVTQSSNWDSDMGTIILTLPEGIIADTPVEGKFLQVYWRGTDDSLSRTKST